MRITLQTKAVAWSDTTSTGFSGNHYDAEDDKRETWKRLSQTGGQEGRQ